MAVRKGQSKRGNGEGNIRKRESDGRWEARVTGDNGKPKSLYGKTRAEVASKLATWRHERERGQVTVRDERLLLSTFIEDWLIRHGAEIDYSTNKRYHEFMRLHVLPTLGKVPLTKLTPQQLERLYAEKLKTLSASTVKKIHLCIHLCLEDALRKGLVVRNVSEMASAPKPPRARFSVWNADEAQRFLTTAQGTRYEALYVTALTTGMRLGELLALRWRDVDLDAGALYLSGNLRRRKGEGLIIKKTKTHSSRRRIALSATTVQALRAHKARQNEERLLLGELWDDSDLVFANRVGRGIEQSHLESRDYYPTIERAGVPRIRFHDLRHTAATLLLRAGVHPKVVSEMLGHASVSITLDLYSHFLPDMQHSATSAMDTIFGSTFGSGDGFGSVFGSNEAGNAKADSDEVV